MGLVRLTYSGVRTSMRVSPTPKTPPRNRPGMSLSIGNALRAEFLVHDMDVMPAPSHMFAVDTPP